MSRRRIVPAIGVATAAAVGLAIIVPPYFSPIPGLVAELKNCLQPVTDEPGEPEANPGHSETIMIELQFAGFNTTRAGTTLLTADAAGSGGLVKDFKRIRTALEELRSEGCVALRTGPQVITVTGQRAWFDAGGVLQFTSVMDGKPVVVQKRYGTSVQATPTVCKDGRIHLHLELTQTDPRSTTPEKALEPEFDVVSAKASFVLEAGQTGFIGGISHRCKLDQGYQAGSGGALRVIGWRFRFRDEREIDEELLVLATPKLVPPPPASSADGRPALPIRPPPTVMAPP